MVSPIGIAPFVALDGSDFGLWNANKFTSSAVSVPEPAAILLTLLGCFCLLGNRQVRGRIRIGG